MWIGVSAIVPEGDDGTTLASTVGHILGTARPGERGNMALAEHRDSFSRALRHIRVDDVIHIRTLGRGYAYGVDSTEVVRAEETPVLDPIGDAVFTLVTRYPLRMSRVRAEPIRCARRPAPALSDGRRIAL